MYSSKYGWFEIFKYKLTYLLADGVREKADLESLVRESLPEQDFEAWVQKGLKRPVGHGTIKKKNILSKGNSKCRGQKRAWWLKEEEVSVAQLSTGDAESREMRAGTEGHPDMAWRTDLIAHARGWHSRTPWEDVADLILIFRCLGCVWRVKRN